MPCHCKSCGISLSGCSVGAGADQREVVTIVFEDVASAISVPCSVVKENILAIKVDHTKKNNKGFLIINGYYHNHIERDKICSKPMEPWKPGKPMEPWKPGKPMKPWKPGKPMKPRKPGKPMEPVKPGKPMETRETHGTMETMEARGTMETVKPGKHIKPWNHGTSETRENMEP